jgi:RNA polymerase sigma factor (sigma-70 family)
MLAPYEEVQQRICDSVQVIHLGLEEFRTLIKGLLRQRFVSYISDDDLDDIVSDTLIWACVHIFQYNQELSSLATWLSAKAHYSALEFLRHHLHTTDIDPLADTLASEVEMRTLGVDPQNRALIDEALAKITPRRAEVIRKHYLDVLSIAAIAQELGISQAGVRSLLSRGLEDLRQIFGSQVPNHYAKEDR